MIADCEVGNLSGECNKTACVTTCEEMRCEGGAFARYELKGTDVDGDALTVRIVKVPTRQFILNGAIEEVNLGKVYQAVKEQSGGFAQIRDSLNQGNSGTWGIVKDTNGIVKYVPDRGTEGRPYGGALGKVEFVVSDGYADSANIGEA